MIFFNNVTKDYGGNTGLIDASLHINSGDFVFLVGPSGAGKTTFIKLILKETEPDSGKIVIAGKDVTNLSRREIPHLRQKIGMVFQDFRLLEQKTVYENVAFAMEVLHKNKKEIKERVPYVLKLVDIQDKANRYPNELSAGEQQRVGIARALVNSPRVLICDEPTGNLDPVTAMDIMALLEKINVRGTTVLMVTHAKDIVDKMNKRVVAIENGRIVRDEEGRYGFKTEDPDAYDPNRTLDFNASAADNLAMDYTTSVSLASIKSAMKREAAETAAVAARVKAKEQAYALSKTEADNAEDTSDSTAVVSAVDENGNDAAEMAVVSDSASADANASTETDNGASGNAYVNNELDSKVDRYASMDSVEISETTVSDSEEFSGPSYKINIEERDMVSIVDSYLGEED